MAMDGNAMGLAITDAIMNMDAPMEVQVKVIEMWQKICCAIVEHIQNNAEVPSGIALSVTVSTTGTSAAQTGGGTGSTTAAGKVI